MPTDAKGALHPLNSTTAGERFVVLQAGVKVLDFPLMVVILALVGLGAVM